AGALLRGEPLDLTSRMRELRMSGSVGALGGNSQGDPARSSVPQEAGRSCPAPSPSGFSVAGHSCPAFDHTVVVFIKPGVTVSLPIQRDGNEIELKVN